ncbi:NfeD family protein [Methanocella arvoryzae]|nr:NfeD family protein [Methanocella arvoryzae]
MLIVGALLLVVEALTPGFFVAVPATILIVMGLLVVLAPGLLTFPWGLIIFALVTIVVSIATILFYRRLAPGHKPIVTGEDSLAGKTGEVIRDVVPGSIDGKVKVDEQIWSATSAEKIEAGQRVRVIRAEGVHIIVCRLTDVTEGGECKK